MVEVGRRHWLFNGLRVYSNQQRLSNYCLQNVGMRLGVQKDIVRKFDKTVEKPVFID